MDLLFEGAAASLRRGTRQHVNSGTAPVTPSSLLLSSRKRPLPGVQEAQAALPVAVLQGGELEMMSPAESSHPARQKKGR